MRLSVIIPIRGEPSFLPSVLSALRSSSHPAAEIIVVDDGSTPEYARLIEPIVESAGARFLRQAPAGPAAARNLGAHAASGDLLLFVDADVFVHPGTLAQIVDAFAADPHLDGLFGAYDSQPAAGTLVSDYRNLLHHYVHLTSRRQASTFWAGLGALRRSVFLASGGFDTSFARPSIEDVEFGLRLTAQGHRLELRPEIQCTHAKRWTLGSFLRTDLFQRAIPWTEMMFTRAAALPPDLNFGFARRLSVPLALLLLLGLPLATRLPWLGLLFSAGAAVALALLNTPFLAYLARLRGPLFALGAFPLHVLHYAVSGLGFAAGAWRIWRRRDPAGLAAVLLFAVIILGWQFASGAFAADFASYPDEASHFVTGAMISEYLRHPTLSPMGFAEQYYLRFPRVAIGHFPPLFYLIEGLWFAVFGVSRLAALLLQSLLALSLTLLVYGFARRWVPPLAAGCCGLLLLASNPIQMTIGRVMTDSATSLFVISATLAFALYLQSPGLLPSLTFGTLSALALLNKGTACPLIALPLIAILFTRRFRLLTRPDLWAAALPVLTTAVPWYLWAAKFSEPEHRAVALRTLQQVQTTQGVAWLDVGLPLLLLAFAGSLLLIRKDVFATCLAALIVSYALSTLVVGAFQESRHILPVAVAAAALTAGLWSRFSRPARPAVVAVAATYLLAVRLISYPPAQFRHALPDLASGAPVLLTAPPLSEGAMVAALAEADPRLGPPVFRASRVLSNSTFNGNHYELLVHSPTETLSLLNQLGVARVVATPDARSPHDALLAAVIATWARQSRPGFSVAQHPHPPSGASVTLEQRRLRRKITLAP